MGERGKRKDPTSEASQAAACRLLVKRLAAAQQMSIGSTMIAVVDTFGTKVHAVFDLRDCYRLRKPLRGIKAATKALKKATR